MALVSASKSTTVRSSKSASLTALRLSMGLGGVLAPQATAGRAASLFSTPFPGSRERALQAGLNGAQVQFLDVGEEEIAVYRWGDFARQPIVLFSHGWSSFGLRVSSWLNPLRDAGYAVASFDQLAHGRSTGTRAVLPDFARIATAVAKQLGPIDTMIGHSLGGTAVALALANGVQARRAILISPAADPHAATERFSQRLGLSERVSRQMRSIIAERAGASFESLMAQHVVPRLSQQALIVHDLADHEVPWEEGERYARYWPGAHLLSTHDLGHHRIVSDTQVIEAGLRFMHGEQIGERVVSTPNLPFGLS